MLEKSRLKELIEQGATIYYLSDFGVSDIDLSKIKLDKFFEDGFNYYINSEFGYGGKLHIFCDYEKLYEFETKEDAEWYLKFCNITRTETLSLPSWEKFLKDNFGIRFYYKSREFHLHKVRYSADDNNPQWKINIYEDYGDDCDTVAWEKEWDLTKENYIKACELAKKLFLGEEV